MNFPIDPRAETVEYDGIIYEKRSIARGEFQHDGQYDLREDVHVSPGDQLFFIDPRKDPTDSHHRQVITVKKIDPEDKMIYIQDENGERHYIKCCFHRIVKFIEDVSIEDFNAVFD